MVEATQRPIRGEQLFASHGLALHALTVVGGVALWLVVYVGIVFAGGWSDVVASASGGKLRLLVGGAAGVATGLYFAVAYAHALGSPIGNLLVPSMVTVLMPTRFYALGAASPTPQFAGEWVVQSACLAAGSGVTLIGVILWYRVRFGGMANATEWENVHFPPGFRLAETATADGGVDFEKTDYGLSADALPSYGELFLHATVVLVFTVLIQLLLDGAAVIADNVVLVALSESTLTTLAVVGFGYVAYLNREWRRSAGLEQS